MARSLDIILPCYQPIQGWSEHVIDAYRDIAARLPDITIHLILVNDGSLKGVSDTDIDVLKKNIPTLQYIHYPVNRGKGYALRKGVEISDADICIYTDIDFPYVADSFIKIWNSLMHDETDIAVGIKDAQYYAHVPTVRRMISKVLRSCSKFILRLKVSDTQCGLKGFNKKGRTLFLKTTIDRYLFDLEFIFLASRDASVRILPVEIQLRDNVQFSSMRAGILFNEGINFIKIFFKSL